MAMENKQEKRAIESSIGFCYRNVLMRAVATRLGRVPRFDWIEGAALYDEYGFLIFVCVSTGQ